MGSNISTTLLLIFVLLIINIAQPQLTSTFYDSTCPEALSAIRTSIRQAVAAERRMAASLIRLHYHDCFVQGCDASVLLNDTDTFVGEQNALPNKNSVRGFGVIEEAKRAVESICPGVVSCADVLAVAARDASVAVGGPSWTVNLGRRDSTTASQALANLNVPSFRLNLTELLRSFAKVGLTDPRDLVALSGAHTIGQAQCSTFRKRIYSNGSDIEPGFASMRRSQCPGDGTGGSNIAGLDLATPNSFDNNYFRNLAQRRGLLITDQALFSGGSTDSIVAEYIENPDRFASDFAAAMVRMGDIEPLTGQNGVIRTRCSALH